MILLFLPTMTVLTFVFVWTAIFIIIDEGPWSPILTLIFRVDIELRLPSEILPIVGENALVPLMVSLIIRTPYCLKMKHVKVWVLIEFVNQLHWYFRFWMSERAEISILAFSGSINIRWTKLGFVFIRMIKFFYSIMSFCARISIRAVFVSGNVIANFRLIRSQWSPLILFLVMIIRASFEVVRVRIHFARTHFK